MLTFKSLREKLLSKIQELKKDDDAQLEPYYSDTSGESNPFKKKKSSTNNNDSDDGDSSSDSDDSKENSVAEGLVRVGRPRVQKNISAYNLIVVFLRSKGLDPYKISQEQRSMWKKSPAFAAWKRINKYESVEETDLENSLIEDLLDVDKLNKGDAGVNPNTGVQLHNMGKIKNKDKKNFDGFKAELVMTRKKTLTGSKKCDVIMVDPAMKQPKPHQYFDRNNDDDKNNGK